MIPYPKRENPTISLRLSLNHFWACAAPLLRLRKTNNLKLVGRMSLRPDKLCHSLRLYPKHPSPVWCGMKVKTNLRAKSYRSKGTERTFLPAIQLLRTHSLTCAADLARTSVHMLGTQTHAETAGPETEICNAIPLGFGQLFARTLKNLNAP